MPVTGNETDNALAAYQKLQEAERAAQEEERKANLALADAERVSRDLSDDKGGEGNEDEAQRIAEAKKIEDERIEAENIAAEALRNKDSEIDYDKIDLDKVLEKKTAGKYKKFADIEDKLNQEPAKLKYANEFIEKYNEAIEKGISHDVFIKTQSTDYSKLSEIDKIKHGMMIEDPSLTPEDISLLIEDTYKLDEDQYDEKTIKLAKINLKRDALRFEKTLLDMQVKSLTPSESPEIKRAAQLAAEQAIKDEEFKIRWEKESTEALSKFKDLKVRIGDGEQDVFSYQPEKSEMEFVAEVVKTPDKLWSLFRNQDGTINQTKLIEGIALLKSSGNMAPKMAAAMKASAIEEYVKSKKNIDFGSGGKNQQQKTTASDSIKRLAAELT